MFEGSEGVEQGQPEFKAPLSDERPTKPDNAVVGASGEAQVGTARGYKELEAKRNSEHRLFEPYQDVRVPVEGKDGTYETWQVLSGIKQGAEGDTYKIVKVEDGQAVASRDVVAAELLGWQQPEDTSEAA